MTRGRLYCCWRQAPAGPPSTIAAEHACRVVRVPESLVLVRHGRACPVVQVSVTGHGMEHGAWSMSGMCCAHAGRSTRSNHFVHNTCKVVIAYWRTRSDSTYETGKKRCVVRSKTKLAEGECTQCRVCSGQLRQIKVGECSLVSDTVYT